MQERSKETREKLIAAAMRLFKSKSYQNVNSKDIAREAGVAIGSFYSYFPDKKELFKELLENFFQEYSKLELAKYLSNPDKEDPHVLLVNMIKYILDFIMRFDSFYRDLYALCFSDAEIFELVSDFYHRLIDDVENNMMNYKFMFNCVPSRASAHVCFLILENTIKHLLFFHKGEDTEELISEVARCLELYLFGSQSS